MPDSPSQQLPCCKQEDNDEHEHDWEEEQKCSAKQVVDDINTLNTDFHSD